MVLLLPYVLRFFICQQSLIKTFVMFSSTTNTALSIEGLTHQFLFLDFKTNGEQGWSDIRMIIKLLILALVLNVGFIVTDCNGGIVYPKAPDGGEQAVSNILNSGFFKRFHLPPAKDLSIAKPFTAYDAMYYTNLLYGRFLSETKLCWWRFLLMDGTNLAGAMDLGYDKKKGGWPNTEFAFYPTSTNFSEGLRMAEKLPQVKEQDYELRYLNFLEIEFFAIWLHGKSSDIIIPLPPVFGRCEAYRPYSEREMMKILKQEMEKELTPTSKTR